MIEQESALFHFLPPQPSQLSSFETGSSDRVFPSFNQPPWVSPMTGHLFPQMAAVRQSFPDQAVASLESGIAREIDSLGLQSRTRPGQTVAVTAGSRGIHGIDRILRSVCDELKGLDLQPFIVPAMGSHGGATSQGQLQVLASYGITEQSMGVPVTSSMDTVTLGTTSLNTPVHVDRTAHEADHIVAVNRIKAHTKFKAPIESGLMKMLAVGLGKHTGASLVHRLAVDHSLSALIRETARSVLNSGHVLFGLGLVENAFGRTAGIKAMLPEDLETAEEELLERAKAISARLPFDDLDLLIVDRIGKDISGTGMDTNVTGRNRDILGDFTVAPRIKRIVVRDLTEATEGNGLGIGFADFCTRRLVDRLDLAKTYTNAMTGVSPEKAAIPMHMDTDRETIAAALESLGNWAPGSVRVVRIQDTLHLERIGISSALIPELPDHCTLISAPGDMAFSPEGDLADPVPGG